MKKEKWLLNEIDRWQSEEIINEETANTLRGMYVRKKSVNVLMILFSVIGSVLIGMGIVLVSANNWWYSLPVAVRTFIGFLPLFVSQGLVFYVLRSKMNSVAFRESASLLNMAGVFASIAIVGQIFHLPGDFTNNLLVCGALSFPTILIMNAFSPLIIYFWTAINGGLFFENEAGIIIGFVMFALGAAVALSKCREENGKSIYLSLITAVSGFVLIFVASLRTDCELTVMLLGYFLLLLCGKELFEGAEAVFEAVGRLGFLILTAVLSYEGLWSYWAESDSVSMIVITAVIAVTAAAYAIKKIISKKSDVFIPAALLIIVMSAVWVIFGLNTELLSTVFMVIINIIMFVLSVICIALGAKALDFYMANTGMVTLCTLIVMRFFDSEMPLFARGIVFLILGCGFLLFNLYLLKIKKREGAR